MHKKKKLPLTQATHIAPYIPSLRPSLPSFFTSPYTYHWFPQLLYNFFFSEAVVAALGGGGTKSQLVLDGIEKLTVLSKVNQGLLSQSRICFPVRTFPDFTFYQNGRVLKDISQKPNAEWAFPEFFPKIWNHHSCTHKFRYMLTLCVFLYMQRGCLAPIAPVFIYVCNYST